MKKLLVLLMGFFILALPLGAQAMLYTFSGTDEGGIGSATMDISIIGNTLTANIENTSPTDLIGAPAGSGGNSPGITGFGFNLDPDTLSLTSWELEAFDENDLSSPITIGNGSPGLDWMMYTTQEGVTLDYLPHTTGGIDGALYNPDTLSDLNNTLPGGVNDTYFTKALLTMNFDQIHTLLSDFENYYIRMQNVGLDGEGSLKLNPIPEPATMLLLGSGLIAFAMVGRKKFFKKG